MSRLAEVSRAGFYRCLQERLPVEEGDGGAVGDSAQSPSGTGGAKTGLALLAIWLDDDRQAA